MGYLKITTLDQYRNAIDGIDTSALPEFHNVRFERLDSVQIEALNAWYSEHGFSAIVTVSSPEMALGILGATEVTSLQPYDFSLGKGKECKYYVCSLNTHNRVFTPNQGMESDKANGLWGVGPSCDVDPFGNIENWQHRVKSDLRVFVATGVFPVCSYLVHFALPLGLSGSLDRNKPRTGKDQSFMDSSVFPSDLISEYFPELLDCSKVRDQACKILETVRNNVFARLVGNEYHPAKKAMPTTRQALECEDSFGSYTLQRLVLQLLAASVDEGGKKRHWAQYVTPAAIASAIVLSQTRKGAINWSETEVSLVVESLIECTELGEEGLSKMIQSSIQWKNKKLKASDVPTFDRVLFSALVPVVNDILTGESVEAHWPDLGTAKQLKSGKLEYPRFGGLDSPKSDE